MNKTLLTALGAALALSASAQFNRSDEKLPPDQKVRYAEKIIETYYVDDVDGEKLAQEAIVAMLKTLDPHSSYSDPEETKELTTPLEGNFSGIGIQFNMLNDTLYVIQTTSGGPSEKVGILPGDRILSAGDSIISGVKRQNSSIIKILRGPKGTRVDLKVERRGVAEPIEFTVTRDDIPIYSIDAAYMIDSTTGFIKVARFGEETEAEMQRALKDLQRQGMKNLIIDLEDNGGGYLNAAHQLAAHFLDKGDLVVYTDSPKMGSQIFRNDSNGDFRQGRVVVMVNQYSASASEILSGAIQDNDRGLVVGRRTFGKGLVQRPFPFPDGSMIRLTVSKYHTPSGRCIQKPYTSGNTEEYQRDLLHRYEAGEFSSADSISLPDSLRYETLRNHRPVYGGGGIMPDVFVPIDTTGYSNYYRDLTAKGVLIRYSLGYIDEHRAELKRTYPTEADFLKRFTVTPEMLADFVAMGQKEGVEPNDEQFETSRTVIAAILKGLIGRDLYDTATYYKAVYPVLNPVYNEAIRLINDPERYNALLRGDEPAPKGKKR